jgi:hypothetical protein
MEEQTLHSLSKDYRGQHWKSKQNKKKLRELSIDIKSPK